MLYNKQYKWQDDLIHNVGLIFFKKDWVIKEIAYHPLKFAKRSIEDEKDTRPTRIRYFGTFVMKEVKNKERVTKYKEIFRDYNKYKPILKELGYDINTEDDFKKVMYNIGNKEIYKVDNIYNKGLVISEKQVIM
jgi:hypothetical protein